MSSPSRVLKLWQLLRKMLSRSLIIVKSKAYETEIIKYQEQVSRFVVVLDKKNYYLLSYNGRKSEFLESGNVVIPEFIEWVRKKHGVPTNHEILMELKNIGNLCRSRDILAYNEIKALIEKLEK